MFNPHPIFLFSMCLYCLANRILPFALEHFGLNIRHVEFFPWSYTPIFAFCIFGVGMYRNLRTAIGVPLLCWLAGDVLIGALRGAGYGWSSGISFGVYPDQVVTYLAVLAVCACGLLIRQRRNWLTIAAATLAGPTVFFLVSNFGAWLFDTETGYARDWMGILACYAAGVPFYQHQLLSTVGFSALLFSPLGLWTAQQPERRPVNQPELAPIRISDGS